MTDNIAYEAHLIAAEEEESVRMKADEVERIESVERDYEKLENLPRINSVQLIGNKSLQDIGIEEEPPVITELEIRKILKKAKEG